MLVTAGLLAALGSAPAEPSVALEWPSTPGCDEGARAAWVLARLLEGSSAPRGQRAVVTIRPLDEAWVATVTIETPAGMRVRTLQGAPCRLLADAVALVVAIAVDPLGATARVDAPPPRVAAGSSAAPRVSSPPPPTPRSAVEARPAAVDEARADPEPPGMPPRRPAVALAGLVEGGAAIGMLPGPRGFWSAGLTVTRGRLRLAVAGGQLSPRTVSHSRFAGVGARVSGASGRLSACWVPRAGSLSMPVCLGIEGGAFLAEGYGLRQTRTIAVPWVAAVPHAQPTLWVTSWLGLGITLAVPVALVRAGLRIDDEPGEFVRVEPLGVLLGPSLEVVFFDENRRRRARGQ